MIGPLPVVATCLEHGIPYTHDRIAQGDFVADRATDPQFDGPCPALLMGDLNAAADSATLPGGEGPDGRSERRARAAQEASRSTTQSMQRVSWLMSSGSTLGNMPTRSWLRPSLR